jgi:hypothetical protein
MKKFPAAVYAFEISVPLSEPSTANDDTSWQPGRLTSLRQSVADYRRQRPGQWLRYQDPLVFHALLTSAGLDLRSIAPIGLRWTLLS